MKRRHWTGWATLLLILLAGPACEDTEVTAPEGSVITLTAAGPVFIDQTEGETQGHTTVVAQIVGSTGLPVNDIPLFFTTDEGLLASTMNVCGDDGTCTDGTTCVVDADCPDLPDVVETDDNGIATDVLTLRLLEDGDQATVTVKGTSLQATVAVSKDVFSGFNPEAVIVADPPGGQRTGLPFLFDGSDSTFDPLALLTCFEWNIVSSVAVFDPFEEGCVPCAVPGTGLCEDTCTDRGEAKTVLPLKIGVVGDPDLDQDLAIVLRVSDDPTIVCTNSDPVDEGKFSSFPDTLTYIIRCDVSDPSANAGSDKDLSFAADGTDLDGDGFKDVVFVSLDGSGSDPEDIPPLDFEWNCGSGGVCDPVDCKAKSVTCAYSTVGSNTATLFVRNDCLREDTDSVLINIQP